MSALDLGPPSIISDDFVPDMAADVVKMNMEQHRRILKVLHHISLPLAMRI